MSARAEVMLRVTAMHAGYGPVDVLHGISLEVRRGEIVSLIGANGAGKSTMLRCISRIHASRTEVLQFQNHNVQQLPAHAVVACGLAHVPEGRRIFGRLTVRENLQMGAYCRNDTQGIAHDLEHVHDIFPILRDRAKQQGGTLSGGEQQMLAIGRALMSKPSLLMMDEPSMGIAPILVARIFEAVQKLRDEGMTILLVEQNARAALKLSDRGYVLETGRITLSGNSADLLQDRRVQEAYLGE